MGEAHFVAIPSSVKVLAASVTADDVVEPSRHGVLNVHVSSRGSFAVRAGERSAHEISSLNDGEAYDVYFVTEVCYSVPFLINETSTVRLACFVANDYGM